jgi:hypothetical protein
MLLTKVLCLRALQGQASAGRLRYFRANPTRSSELGRIGGREKGPLLRRLRNWPGRNRGNLWIPDSESHVIRELSAELSYAAP